MNNLQSLDYAEEGIDTASIVVELNLCRKASHSICKIPENERRKLIAISAYLLAEKRSFATGHEDEDWLAAEHIIDECVY
ncbi:MAG: DUF2934 domain-containing protein [Methylophilaceae bacterium]|nr:MAG: DUF2934 domain-containing protein [Methylophilaceae bacterium]